MTWIEFIEFEDATGELRQLYEQSKNPDNTVDRVLKIHSLRPRTLEAYLYLYKAVLHTRPNELSYRERELVGTYMSHLNGCEYCVQHHKTGVARFLKDHQLVDTLLKETKDGTRKQLTKREVKLLAYSKKLTLSPQEMVEADIEPLYKIGLSDTGILDLNQLVSYFKYVNPTVNGLGVDIAGETLGFHASKDSEGFKHT